MLTGRDADVTTWIIGPSEYTAQEKHARHQRRTVHIHLKKVSAPLSIMKFCKDAELLANAMHLNGILF